MGRVRKHIADTNCPHSRILNTLHIEKLQIIIIVTYKSRIYKFSIYSFNILNNKTSTHIHICFIINFDKKF